jgi:Peptidase M50B-like
MPAPSPAPSLSTVLDRIGQTQAPLPASTAVLLGVAVLAVLAVPALWLVAQHVDTMAHEGAHALVGSGMGRRIGGVLVNIDGDGLTRVPGGVLIGVVGYLGPSAFGLVAAKLISAGHSVAMLWLTLLLLGMLLVMIRNLFGAVAVATFGIVVYAIARYASIQTETVTAYLITWFLLLSGLRTVIQHGPGAGDAGILAGLTRVPRALWCGLWLVGATVALVVGGGLLV